MIIAAAVQRRQSQAFLVLYGNDVLFQYVGHMAVKRDAVFSRAPTALFMELGICAKSGIRMRQLQYCWGASLHLLHIGFCEWRPCLLKKEWKKIIEYCPCCGTAADIGYDHGRISAALIEQGICRKGHLPADISSASLQKQRCWPETRGFRIK